MPLRRSTRSRASVEPDSVERAQTSKRKRTSPNENEAPSPEELQASKSSSRTRKPPSTRSSSATDSQRRVTTRSKPNVHESEEEQDDEGSRPPTKKSRPSLDNEDGDSESEHDVKPPKTRRAPARKASSTSTAARRQQSVVKEEEEEEPHLEAAASRSRASSAQPSTRGKTVRGSRSRKAKIEEEEVVADEPVDIASESEEDEEPPKSARQKAKRRGTKDSDGDSDFEDLKPARRGRGSNSARSSVGPSRRGRTASTQRAKPPSSGRSRRASVVEGEEGDEETSGSHPSGARHDADDDSDALIFTEPSSRRKKTTPARPEPIEEVEEEEEEEHSLLEPEVTVEPAPAPKIQIQPVVAPEPEGPKARLVIHKLVLVDFKSYAGRQEIGPFHKSFSAIVGPNGSGKSNTIDALLFVFGYRASKMRQAKLSELIHNSAKYPDLEECSVEIHFREIIDEPGDAFELVPDSQLVVTRTAYKNNSSRYSINERLSNYKEVQVLLKGRGIDLDHNRFLILQGEVESIAQMKPKAPSEHEDGLLEYLEDIIGTSRYKEPIEAALVEMEKYQEERNEKLNRLKIVERERGALEKQKKEAEDYLRLQNEHGRALSRLWQWYIWRCLLNENEFAKKMEACDKELKEETAKHKDDIDHLAALQQHYDERCATYEEVKAAAIEATKEMTSKEKEQVNLEERRKHAKSKAKKLQKTLTTDKRSLEDTLRAITENEEKIEKHKRALEQHEAELTREERVLEQIRDSLKDKTQVFHDKIEIKQKELEPWTAKINKKQAEIDVASSERDALAKKAEQLQDAVREADETLSQLRGDHQAKLTTLDELRNTKSTRQSEFEADKRKFERMRAQMDELKSKASSARQRFEEAKKTQSDSTTQNRVLDGLTRLRASGRVSGFHGRLGSLGTIPDKYDVAVSTACPSLHHMVVDTVDQGQVCIEHLRKQNLGRASFMVLEKLSSHGIDKISTPENVPRLFDLIKPKEPRFAPAFYKAAHNTLVANDMEQASRIAYGGSRRWRVVTLAGELIEASGAMTGGGTTVFRGSMSSKLQTEAVSPQELQKLEQECAAAEQARDSAVRNLRELEAELDAMAQAGPSIDTAIQKINLDIKNCSTRIEELEVRVRELKAKNKPNSGDLARISTLESEIARATAELERLQAQTASIKDEIAGYEKKILEIGGSKLLAQKSKVDGLNLHIRLAGEEITKAEVGKAKAEKDSAKLETSIANNETSLAEATSEVERLEEEIGECVQMIDEIREKVNQAQEAADNSKEDLDSLKTQLDEKSDAIETFRKKEMELKQAIADIRKDAKDNDHVLQHWQTEHDKLELVYVDDDEEDAKEGDGQADAEGSQREVKADPDRPKSKDDEDPFTLHIYTEAELASFDRRELVADSELLDEKLKASKPNMSVIEDYRKREEEFLKRAQDYEEVTRLRDEQKQQYEGLRTQRLNEFMAGFNAISLKLKEMYQMITLGGNAELELVDSIDPFSEGIIFSVMPPKKSWRNISNLSGGEKTLSSLALVFALHVYKPTPLYFMDEIDAALDFRNVSIVANYIKDRTKNAQFIIISLRNDMFELSQRLIGIYKTSNATRSIAIDNHALHAVPLPPAQA